MSSRQPANPDPMPYGPSLLVVGLVVTGVFGISWMVSHRDAAPAPEKRVTSVAQARVSQESIPWRPAQRRRAVEAAPALPGITSLLTALDAARAETNPAQGSAAMARLADSVPDSQLGAVLGGLPSRDLASEFGSLLMRRWAAREPAAAAEWIEELPAGPEKTELTSQLTVAWAAADLPAALAWLKNLPAGAEKDTTTLGLAYEAARSEPAMALDLAVALPPGNERDQFLSHAVSDWTATDVVAAAKWVEQIADEPLRRRLVGALATAAAEADGPGAATLVAQSLPPGEEQNRAAVGVVQRWAQQDAPQTATWVERFPDGPAREAAAENLVKLWSSQDTRQTADWLNRLTDDSLRDHAIGVYANAISTHHPSVAIQWAQTIRDTSRREREMASVARNWLALDAPAARQWLAQAPLPAETKARLQSQMPPITRNGR